MSKVVQVKYHNNNKWYAFNAPNDAQLGDAYDDGGRVVIVTGFGSNYKGPLRWVGTLLARNGISIYDNRPIPKALRKIRNSADNTNDGGTNGTI